MKGVMRGMVWFAVLSAGWVGQAFGWWEPDVSLIRSDSICRFGGWQTQWAIATDFQNGVHVVWTDTRDSGLAEAYYKHSSNEGTTWGPDIRLSSGTDPNGAGEESPAICCDNRGRVHVVYTDVTSQVYSWIHYRRSTDLGETWEAQRNLAQIGIDFQGNASLTTDGRDGVYLAYTDQTGPGWLDNDVFFIRSSDGGSSWGPNLRMTSTQTSRHPSICADTLGRVHMVWDDGRTGRKQKFYCRSTDRGITWGSQVQISSATGAYFDNSSIAGDRGDNLHVVYDRDDQSHPANFELYYLRSSDGGSTWGSDTRLTFNPTNRTPPRSLIPNIAADPYGGVYIVCQDSLQSNGPLSVCFLSSTDRGTTWSAETQLSSHVFQSTLTTALTFPNIAVDTNRQLHVAWTNDTLFSQRPGHPTIYYKRGSLFSGVEEQAVRLAEGPSVSKLQLKVSSPTRSPITFRYLLPKPALVELGLYDALGRKMANLYEGERAAGWHELRRSLDLPGGVYFIKLASCGKALTHRVVVLR